MHAVVRVLAACPVAAVLLTGGTAEAAVTFDEDTGKGFASKADVRGAFGWTADELEDNARSLSFVYVDTKKYRAVCRKDSRSDAFTAQISRETVVRDKPRRRGATLLGFDLLGYGGGTSSTNLFQQEGEQCTGSDADGTFTGEWGPVKQTSEVIALFVRDGRHDRRLT